MTRTRLYAGEAPFVQDRERITASLAKTQDTRKLLWSLLDSFLDPEPDR